MNLKAAAVSDRPAGRLLHVDQNGFLGFLALRVLGRNLDLVKEPQVVKLALRRQEGAFVDRLAVAECEFAPDNSPPRVLVAQQNDSLDRFLISRVNLVLYIPPMCLVRR